MINEIFFCYFQTQIDYNDLTRCDWNLKLKDLECTYIKSLKERDLPTDEWAILVSKYILYFIVHINVS